MRTSKVSLKNKFTCGRCAIQYSEYKHLVEHLYWRHGTESAFCQQCQVKRWSFAAHKCHILPINIEIVKDSNWNPERESEFCSCGKNVDAPMIGCDGPNCELQWYHFDCVGITSAPDGDWFCPTCDSLHNKNQVMIIFMIGLIIIISWDNLHMAIWSQPFRAFTMVFRQIYTY